MFSVIIATHNRPEMLIRAINSVLCQNLADTEIIVINDGSTCSYDSVLDIFFTLMSSNKIKYMHNDRSLGVSASRNIAVDHASNSWIVFLDDDDLFAENYLVNLKSLIENHESDVDFFWGNVKIIDIDKNNNLTESIVEYPIEFADKDEFYRAVLSIGTSYGVAVKKSVFDGVGGFDETLPVCEDFDFIVRLLESEKVLKSTGVDAVIKHQEHSDRLSHQFSKYSDHNIYERIFKKHANFFIKNPNQYLELHTWSMKVNLSNNNVESLLELLTLDLNTVS